MFRRYKRRHTNILFVIFRLMLSLAIFAALLAGMYSAYKHFSGLDPLKLDPQAIISYIKLPNEINQKILGQSNQDQTKPAATHDSKVSFNFILIADSHSDNVNLRKVLAQSEERNPAFLIGLGDYTEVGTIKELQDAKSQLDSSGLRYFLTPGDHDLWECRDKSLLPNCNFKEVFGPSYQSFTHNEFKFIILYNSDNYLGIDQDQLDWLGKELEKASSDNVKAIFVFVHEPLYHPSSDHIMGRVEPKLKEQAKNLTRTLKDSGVKEVIAADTHFFSEYDEPETNLKMVTIGAITSQRNPQAPRFAIGYVFEDGSLGIEDMEIK